MTSPGDLITRHGQYEWLRNGGSSPILLNGDGPIIYKITKLDGLFGLPELRQQDIDRQAGDGWIPNTSFYSGRMLIADLVVLAENDYQMMQALEAAMDSFQAEDADGTLCLYRPRVGKRLIYCRVTRAAWPSTSSVVNGVARGVLEIKAHDPRIYSIYENELVVVLAPGVTSGGGVVFMGGTWRRGSPVTITVAGPGTDVRISNSDDSNRQIKFTGTIGSGTTLTVDTKQLTVIDQLGADQSTLLSRDNQWWELHKGSNTIGVNRTGSTGTLTVRVRWRDANVI